MDTTHTLIHAYPSALYVRSVRPASTAPPTMSPSAASERREGRVANSQASPATTSSVVERRITLQSRMGCSGGRAGGWEAAAGRHCCSVCRLLLLRSVRHRAARLLPPTHPPIHGDVEVAQGGDAADYVQPPEDGQRRNLRRRRKSIVEGWKRSGGHTQGPARSTRQSHNPTAIAPGLRQQRAPCARHAGTRAQTACARRRAAHTCRPAR